MLQAAVLRPELSSVFNVDTLRDKSEVWLDAAVDNKMSSFFYTPGALPWWKGDSDGTSMNPMMNAAFLSAIYGPFARGSKVNKYAGWTNFLIDYVLGKNPMNTPRKVAKRPKSSSQVALEAALPTVFIVLALAIAGFVAFKKRDTIRQWSRQRRMKKIGVSYKKEDFV
ncbi:endoglucanase e-4 precursor [Ceraceosorus bombacis]|uniref:cellulase n=1 Tax=Ceraceosorus bombacis TaxID=401625 RepID=A0A0P1BSY5_9BASI|nr:endoglucanase e-4 precursor [Ceraceosorus bombacis]